MTPVPKLRLLFVIDRLSSGGAQRQLVTLSGELHRRGHEVDLFHYRDDPFSTRHALPAGVGLVGRQRDSRYSPVPLLALANRIRTGGYDVVLSFLTAPNLYTLAGHRTVLRRPPLVVSERSCHRTDHRRILNRLAERAYGLADRVTVNSHHLRESLERRCPWLRGRVHTIWNGVDLERFKPTPPPDPAPVPRLLAIGALDPHKNAQRLVEALDWLATHEGLRPSVTWVVRRSHELRPIEQHERAAVDRALERAGLGDQWRWMDEGIDVPALLREHDALVHPSTVEGLPNVVCEALACGRPVLVSDTLDHPRLVEDGRRGFLFDPHSASGFSFAITALHQTGPERRAEMGREARVFAERELSVSLLGDHYESLFHALRSRRQPGMGT